METSYQTFVIENEMAARVEEMVKRLRAFVADAAHELNTTRAALRTKPACSGISTAGEMLPPIGEAAWDWPW